MLRSVVASLALLVLASHASPASADPVFRLETRVGPPLESRAPGELGGQTIFLNKCVGGCTVKPGMDDAQTDTSQIVQNQKSLAEYTMFAPGEWEAVVQCVKEVYSPYNLHVVAERPAAGVQYSEIMIGGAPQDLGLPNGVGGIASVAGNCQPNSKGVSFAFTSAIDVFAAEDGGNRVNGLCWIIAQETAHTWGLDHEYSFTGSTGQQSACNDPMTYRADCGGQKFYRNNFAMCGEDVARACACGGTQNSHQMLLNTFGAGMSIVPAPTVNVTLPVANGQLGAVVSGSAGSKRGIDKVELYLNGYKWAEAKGVAFGQNGQPNPSQYTITVPANIPNSVYDVVFKAYDDLGLVTSSAPIVATKGAACTAADTCLTGQKCENGRCFWDPPSGELGDVCTYAQFCKSGKCMGTATEQVCTQDCIPGVTDSCPVDAGLTCLESSPGHGICFPAATDGGGCCSVSSDRTVWAHGLLGTAVFGFLFLRRRRRS